MLALIDGLEVKPCSKCQTTKPVGLFHKDSTSKTGLAHWCKECANANTRRHNQNNKDNPRYARVKRNGWIRSRHGITMEQYEEKLKAQGNKCGICTVDLPATGPLTHLDHDHTTGKLRDFLCTNCNRGLGHFQDSPELLQEAAKYLNKHKEKQC